MKVNINKEGRKLVVLEESAFLPWCVKHWVECAQTAIRAKGRFIVALSGGRTPQQLYQTISSPEWKTQIDWKRVYLLWSDERAVAPDNPASNYHMAMQAGLQHVGIPQQQIFRMHAEEAIIPHAKRYAEQVEHILQGGKMDLVMLGMGDDGHIASLFPHTEALLENKQLVVANWVPKLDSSRMTMTYPAFERAELTVVYVTGAAKAQTLSAVLEGKADATLLPAQKIGTNCVPALWACDAAAAALLNQRP